MFNRQGRLDINERQDEHNYRDTTCDGDIRNSREHRRPLVPGEHRRGTRPVGGRIEAGSQVDYWLEQHTSQGSEERTLGWSHSTVLPVPGYHYRSGCRSLPGVVDSQGWTEEDREGWY